MPDLYFDSRCNANGSLIPTERYCDQPYIVQTDDNAWLCVVTTGTGHEGQPGQIVISMRSLDQGKSWDEAVALEPADGPEASYAVALKASTGRIYAFYNHNTDRVKDIPCEDGSRHKRVDSLGHYVFKYSDDHGRTWSEKRYEIPVRPFAIDRENPYGGDPVRFFWNVGRPFVASDGSVYLPHSKVGAMGVGFYARSEGAFLHSDNIMTEIDPEKIHWETLPEGDVGLRPPPNSGRVAEEHTIVELSDGTLYSAYRTIAGHPAFAYSRDRGKTWSAPAFKCYNSLAPQPRLFKHARAANFVWKTQGGHYLYWFHNQGGRPKEGLTDLWIGHEAYKDRNPAWISAGREEEAPDGSGKIIVWSEPEILLYDDNSAARLSYPDLIEMDGHFWITETQKTIAHIHRIDDSLIEAILTQHKAKTLCDDALLAEFETSEGSVPFPDLPEMRIRHLGGNSVSTDTRQGFTLDFVLSSSTKTNSPLVTLLDTVDSEDAGLTLTLQSNGKLSIRLGDGRQVCLANSVPLEAGPRHVSIIVDGGPRIIQFVVDGRLQDGGEARRYGWLRFSPTLLHCNGKPNATISPRLQSLRVYGKALKVSEAVGNARHFDLAKS